MLLAVMTAEYICCAEMYLLRQQEASVTLWVLSIHQAVWVILQGGVCRGGVVYATDNAVQRNIMLSA